MKLPCDHHHDGSQNNIFDCAHSISENKYVNFWKFRLMRKMMTYWIPELHKNPVIYWFWYFYFELLSLRYCCYLLYLKKIQLTLIFWGPSWSWSYCSWIYNYLCNQCRSPQKFDIFEILLKLELNTINLNQIIITKRKFKQWWSSISLLSTKRTMTSHLS
jgi:hypothetical protein